VAIVVGAVVEEILAKQPEPFGDTCGHRGFDAGSVAVKLLDDDLRYQQFDLPLVLEDPECNDHSLAVAALGKIEPGRRIDQEAKHGARLRHVVRRARAPFAVNEPRPSS
jgi:hypothetical protein